MEYRYTTGEWRVGPPKTKHGFREIPLTKANRDMLLEMKKQADGGRYVQEEFKEFVFINSKGMPTKNSTYDVHIAKLTKKAAIQNFSMHTLRHTFATRCIEAGMRPKTLQLVPLKSVPVSCGSGGLARVSISRSASGCALDRG